MATLDTNKAPFFPSNTGGTMVEVDSAEIVDDIFVFEDLNGKKFRWVNNNYGVYPISQARILTGGTGDCTAILNALFSKVEIRTVVIDAQQVVTISGTVVIPAGKTLKFETGGMISGSGSLEGEGALIEGGNDQIFDTAITTSGLTTTGCLVNIRWFGATGDGTTDDLPAIAAAIRFANDNRIGKVYFPEAAVEYLVTFSIQLESGIEYYGDGRNSKITCPGAGWTLVPQTAFGIINAFQKNNIVIRNIHLHGTKNAEQVTTPKLFYGQEFDNISLIECIFTNSSWEGIWQGGQISTCTNLSIINCELTDIGFPNSYGGLPAIQMNVTGGSVTGNILRLVGTGIGLSGLNIICSNNKVIESISDGIGVSDNAEGTGSNIVTGNYLEPASGKGISINLPCDDIDLYCRFPGVCQGNIVSIPESAVTGTIGIFCTGQSAINLADNTVIINGAQVGFQFEGSTNPSFPTIINSTNNTAIKRHVDSYSGFTASDSETYRMQVMMNGDKVINIYPETNSSFDFNFNGVLNFEENLILLTDCIYSNYSNGLVFNSTTFGGGSDPRFLGRPNVPFSGSNQAGKENMLINKVVAELTVGRLAIPELYDALTISSGTLTLANPAGILGFRSSISPLNESGALSDDLDSIVGIDQDGVIMMIRPNDIGKNLVVKHGTGNILLSAGEDCTLLGGYDSIVLRYVGKLEKWVELSRSNWHQVINSNKDAFTLTTDGTRDLDAGADIIYIRLKPTSNLTAFKVGISSGGSELISPTAISAGIWRIFSVPYYAESLTTLYFGGITSSSEIAVVKS